MSCKCISVLFAQVPQPGKDGQATNVTVEAVFRRQRSSHGYRLPPVALSHTFVHSRGDKEVDRLTLLHHGDFGTKRAGDAVGAIGGRV